METDEKSYPSVPALVPETVLPDRVLDVENAGVFRRRVRLCDAQYFRSLGFVTTVVPLPVRSDGVIGYASLYADASGLYADLVLDYATPERLELEIGSRDLYCRPLMYRIGPRIADGQIVELHLVDGKAHLSSAPLWPGATSLLEPVL